MRAIQAQVGSLPVQRFETDVHFDCPKCGKLARTAVAVPEPPWGASDKIFEQTSDGPTEVECNECMHVFAAYVFNSGGGCDVTLDDFANVDVHADQAFFSPPEDGDWLDTGLPDDPHIVFMDSYHHTGDILADHGGEDGGHLINRMVFSQLVGALEAYLGDTLIKAVMQKPEALTRLLTADRDLNKEKYTLAEIAGQPDLIRDKVAAYLRSIIYHNLAKVDFLYSAALQVRILVNEEDNAKLIQAINHRHDCVHRNGRDKDGNRLTVFTKEHVQSVADLMRKVVDRVEVEVWGEPDF